MKRACGVEWVMTHVWLRRGVWSRLLWPVSWVFSGLVKLRRWLYLSGYFKVVHVSVPVIVVGNIFVGGTGKTPLVIWLVEALRQLGYVPGVISRGYGGTANKVQEVTGDSDPYIVGDEPVLLAYRAHCPMMVGRDRVTAARALLACYPQVNVVISDDGLQHYALGRTVEIALFDVRGVGNGWVLPAGPLREPATRSVDIAVVHQNGGGSPTADAMEMTLVATYAEHLSDRSKKMFLTELAQMQKTEGQTSARIVAAAGIGYPTRFFSMLRAIGMVFEELPLPDHYDFLENPFLGVQADMILVTEKDAVKCRRLEMINQDKRIWVVPVSAQVDGPFVQRIVEKLHGCSVVGDSGVPVV